jgi:DNA-binding transcriptional LysR family regulator
MGLALTDLKSVVIAARAGSFGRAAVALNISQSALSRRIVEVEAQVGVQLFDRLPRGVRPTPACMAFLRHAEIAVASIDDALAAAKGAKASRAQEISVGFLDVLCDEMLMSTCRSAMTQFPKATVLFTSRSTSRQVSEEVRTGRVKLGLRYRRDEDPQVESAWVKDDAIIVACAPSHPFAKRARATIEQLEREQWLGYPTPSGGASESFNDTLALRGFGGWKTMAVGSFHTQVKLLEGGFGIGLLRRECIRSQLGRGRLVEIETPLPVATPIYLTWRRNGYLGELGDYLRNQICKPARKKKGDGG